MKLEIENANCVNRSTTLDRKRIYANPSSYPNTDTDTEHEIPNTFPIKFTDTVLTNLKLCALFGIKRKIFLTQKISINIKN